MNNHAKMFQINPQDTFRNPNETALHDLLDREFKITVIKMLTEVKRTKHEDFKRKYFKSTKWKSWS